MSDTQLEPAAVPPLMKPPQHLPLPTPAEHAEPHVEPATITTDAATVPAVGTTTATPATSGPESAEDPTPPPARRARRAPSQAAVTVPWDSALPGVTSSEIRAELARRERRAEALLAERQRVLDQMTAIEAALTEIGEDPPRMA